MSQDHQSPAQPQNQGFDPLGGLRNMVRQQVDQAIDQVAHKVPAGHLFSQPTKDAASGILENLEKEAEKHFMHNPQGEQNK